MAGAPEHAPRVEALMGRLRALMSRAEDPVELSVKEAAPAAWSPAMLTPEERRRQAEETARSKALDTL